MPKNNPLDWTTVTIAAASGMSAVPEQVQKIVTAYRRARSEPVILATGFEPFAVYNRNPSWEVVQELAGVYPLLLPVEFHGARALLTRKIQQLQPAAVLSFGLYGRDEKIRFETVGWNFAEGTDNTGVCFNGLLVDDPNAPVAHRSNIDAAAVVQQVAELGGMPAHVTDDAGLFCCNSVLYTLGELNRTGQQEFLWGFIHIPARDDDPQFGGNYHKASFAEIVTSCQVIVDAVREQVVGK